MEGKKKSKNKFVELEKESLVLSKDLKFRVGEYVWCTNDSPYILGKMAHAHEEEIPESFKKSSSLNTFLIRYLHDLS
jgi:hypothetical protein